MAVILSYWHCITRCLIVYDFLIVVFLNRLTSPSVQVSLLVLLPCYHWCSINWRLIQYSYEFTSWK